MSVFSMDSLAITWCRSNPHPCRRALVCDTGRGQPIRPREVRTRGYRIWSMSSIRSAERPPGAASREVAVTGCRWLTVRGLDRESKERSLVYATVRLPLHGTKGQGLPIPAPGKWSILECVEHLAVSEDYLFSQITVAQHSDTPRLTSSGRL
jgi:hypothetical protein